MNDFFESVFPLILVALIVLLSVSKKKKLSGKGSSQNGRPTAKAITAEKVRQERKNISGRVHGDGHTHDRLDTDCAVRNETPEEHYRRQLNSFLKAGLIERSEYNELLRKYTNQQ